MKVERMESLVPAGTAVVRSAPERPKAFSEFLLAAPALTLLAVLYFIPVLMLLSQSLEHGSFENFRKALTESLYLQVLSNTIVIAIYTTAVGLVLGYGVAYLLATTTSRSAAVLILLLVLLPFWTSVLVRTYGWMVLLGRNGVLNKALMSAGVIDSPLPLINNTFGVVVGMVHVLLPYMIFPLVAVMKRIDPALMPAAIGLGASPWAAFLRVYLPLSMPGIVAGSTLIFVLAVGFYITPALLGGGKVAMMATLIEQQVHSFLNWPLAAALSVVLLVATLAVFAIFKAAVARNLEWR